MLILYACTGPLWTRNGCCRVHGPVLAHHSDAFWVMDGGHIVSKSEFRAFEYLALARPNLVGRCTLTNSNYFLPNWQWRPFEIIFIKNTANGGVTPQRRSQVRGQYQRSRSPKLEHFRDIYYIHLWYRFKKCT